MIDLGTIAILGEASIVEARNKVRALALAMGYGEITATRLATATSEIGRRLGTGGVRVQLAGTGDPGGTALALTFEGNPGAGAANVLGRYFDSVRTVGSFQRPLEGPRGGDY